ncbi:hypothetical protein [Teredinibacter haidensis]|uniref:hypothetical protein n=1 Tax=Teredinibacter haidensis TaxID=2731755 RepID=UPI0009491B8A|nr:hypothetical protein [Teredinibacter haidensis]
MLESHPISISKDLTDERLHTLCEHVLDTVQDSIEDSSTPDDTAWTKGCLVYGRLQGMIKRISINKEYSWLSLANSTMDFTAKIGSTHIQFMVDDAYSPKKTHRLSTNSVENTQISMLLEEPGEAGFVTWRLFVGFEELEGLISPKATLVGYDLNQNEVCKWEHQEAAVIPMISAGPAPVEIDEPTLQRKLNNNKTKNEAK